METKDVYKKETTLYSFLIQFTVFLLNMFISNSIMNNPFSPLPSSQTDVYQMK